MHQHTSCHFLTYLPEMGSQMSTSRFLASHTPSWPWNCCFLLPLAGVWLLSLGRSGMPYDILEWGKVAVFPTGLAGLQHMWLTTWQGPLMHHASTPSMPQHGDCDPLEATDCPGLRQWACGKGRLTSLTSLTSLAGALHFNFVLSPANYVVSPA